MFIMGVNITKISMDVPSERKMFIFVIVVKKRPPKQGGLNKKNDATTTPRVDVFIGPLKKQLHTQGVPIPFSKVLIGCCELRN